MRLCPFPYAPDRILYYILSETSYQILKKTSIKLQLQHFDQNVHKIYIQANLEVLLFFDGKCIFT